MIVCDKEKFVFISTPKCGSHTFLQIFWEEFDSDFYKGNPPRKIDSDPYKEMSHSNIILPQHKDYTKITAIRNPFERAVSCWWSYCKGQHGHGQSLSSRISQVGGEDFKSFTQFLVRINNKHPRGMLKSCTAHHNGIKFDHYLSCETAEQDFNSLPFVTSNISVDNRFGWASERDKDWWEYYDEESKANILNVWGSDFTNFNYSHKLPNE
jgi:hypothetical protein